MKSWKLFWTVVFVGSFLTMGLTACGKKDDSKSTSLSYGSLSSDGQTVTSNSTLAGVPLNLQIRNVTGIGGYNAVRFDLSLNGGIQSVQSTPQFPQYVAMGQTYITHAAACTDSSCNTIYVTIVAAGTTYGCNAQYQQCQWDYRQYAFKKVGGTINGLREWSYGANSYSLQTLQQIMGTF